MADHLYNFLTAAGAVAAVAGVGVGALFTTRYGRRATVSLSANPLTTPVGYVLVVRPVVKAVGVFRVRLFPGELGSKVTATEIYTDTSGALHKGVGYPWLGFFGDAFVDGGEELSTTTLIPVPKPAGAVIGWAVQVEVCAPNRFLRLGLLRKLLRKRGFRWIKRLILLAARPVPDRPRKYLSRRLLGPGWTWTDQVFVPLPVSDEVL